MFRPLLVCLVVACSACGPLGPPKTDGGSGGGGGSLFGGGTGGSNGGGTGGGVTGGGSGGGGGVTGGGTGGGVTGGGTGGGATGGGGGAAASLTWAVVSLSGATSSSYITAISGTPTDVWAAQDTGYVFHSTGGAFSLQFSIQYGVKQIYANGGTVVIAQNRSIRTCTSNCTTETAFADYSLISAGLDADAVCGRGPNDITVIASDTQNMGQVFQWDGATWTRTNSNLGIAYPRACWFDDAGVLYVVGQDEVARSDSGATTIETLSNTSTTYYGGASVGGTQWVVGQGGYVGKRTGTTWNKVTGPSTSILWAVGGLSANELYGFGYWDTAAGNGVKWNGTALSSAGNLLPGSGSGSTIHTMLVTGPNEIYAAGNNSSGPIIVRGRR